MIWYLHIQGCPLCTLWLWWLTPPRPFIPCACVLFCLCLMGSGKLGQWGAPGQYTSCSNPAVLPVLLSFFLLFSFLLCTDNLHHILIIAQNPHINDSVIHISSSLLSHCLLLVFIHIGYLCRGLRDSFNNDLQIALVHSSHFLFTSTYHEREMRAFSQSIWLDSTSVHAGRLEWLLKPKIGLLPWLLSDKSFTFPTTHQYVRYSRVEGPVAVQNLRGSTSFSCLSAGFLNSKSSSIVCIRFESAVWGNISECTAYNCF